MRKLKLAFFSFLMSFMVFAFSLNVLAQDQAQAETSQPTVQTSSPSKIYIAEVTDAAEVKNYSNVDYGNSQPFTAQIISGEKNGTVIETILFFPNPQFQEPLKVGEKILIGSVGDITPSSTKTVVSKYRQNNLLVWSFILLGIFLLVSGFKAHIKYLLILLITIVSGILVLVFYHKNTYLTFGSVFIWLFLATIWFAYRVFKSKTPSLLLSLSIFINQLVVMGIVFIMKNVSLIDIGIFNIFFSSSFDARRVMVYIFSLLMLYPISVVFAEQVISESIRKKREEVDILRMKLIQHVSKSALKSVNNIFLAFFGLFYAIFVGVLAIASRQDLVFQSLNNAALSQILSLGFLILLDLLIFVPLVSFIAGIWLGKLEPHEIVTDQNVKQLEL